MTRCKGKTATGRVCRCAAKKDSEFCLTHQPELVAEREKKKPVVEKKKPELTLQSYKRWIYEQEWKVFCGQPAYDYREIGIDIYKMH